VRALRPPRSRRAYDLKARGHATRALVVAVVVLAAGLAAADAARARKTLESRLIPLTPQELLQRTARDEVEVVGLLLEAGVRPDATEPSGWRQGWTALHHAARQRDGKTLALLLKAGAPVNAQAKNGDTALCVAVNEGYPSNVADLLGARADATLVCRDGRTALHEATGRAGEPRPSITTVLLKAGARPDAIDAAGATALFLAAGRAQGFANVEVLLSASAKPDIAARNGRTALHEAVAADHRQIAEALLRAGAAPSPKDGEGDTPLHLAARQDAVEILAILLKYGADTKARNRLGETPLDTAHKNYRARAEDALRAAPAAPARGGAPAPKP
jgi:ankyrin repeat protein